MYQLVSKLKHVKQGLIDWAKSNSLLNPSEVCEEAKYKLLYTQEKLVNSYVLAEEKDAKV